MTSCSSTKVVEVPVTKIKYVDRLQAREDVPLCTIPFAKDLSIESILKLSQRQHTALLECNNVIESFNKVK
tara:strand:- start:42920 stop:43132 length:213 start_codon:yes stop_codon:yes gene_type:complete